MNVSPFSFRAGQLKSLIILILAIPLSTAFSQTQMDDDTRGLKPREYAKRIPKRIIKRRPPSGQLNRQPTATYVAASTNDTIVADGVDVGITFWRVSEAESQRIAARRESVTPKRAAPDTAFADGDQMRIGIEASFEAYVYIVNRERYGDGVYSEPYLVFPSKKDVGTDDKLYPGRIVMVPKDPDYFELTRLSTGQQVKVAEVYTFILSPQPLPDLPPLGKEEPYRKIANQLFERWEQEWKRPLWKFNLQGKADLPMTDDERIAARVNGKRLTQDSILPQTVYHVASSPDNSVIFTVSVPVRK
jgi:hypothetical protein